MKQSLVIIGVLVALAGIAIPLSAQSCWSCVGPFPSGPFTCEFDWTGEIGGSDNCGQGGEEGSYWCDATSGDPCEPMMTLNIDGTHMPGELLLDVNETPGDFWARASRNIVNCLGMPLATYYSAEERARHSVATAELTI